MADRTNDRYQKWGVSRLLSAVVTILEDWFNNVFITPIIQTVIAQMQGLIDDTTFRYPRIDASTNAFETIEYEHHEIHSGSFFVIKSVADLASGQVVDIRITTPAGTKEAHLEAILTVESQTNWWLYEGVAITVAGAALLPLNRNRNSLNASILTFDLIQNGSILLANADTDLAGITIPFLSGIIGSGRGSLGEEDSRKEIILKTGEVYSLRFELAAAGYVNWSLEWYEHQPKD